MQSIHASGGGGGGGGTIVQYATQNQDGQFFVPGNANGIFLIFLTKFIERSEKMLFNWLSNLFSRFFPTCFAIIASAFCLAPADQTRKREIRLQKNREAARECRRKKKEYIKCLENRVAVLENQNKALIEELKSLKELYCSQKTDWCD